MTNRRYIFLIIILVYVLISTTTEDISTGFDRPRKHRKYNPEKYLTMPEIATRHGYQAETHKVVTDDGYILSVHRISNSKSNFTGQPVFLQHGVTQSSVDWILNGNNSLGYLLADHGYDVWLGNVRGNKYSKAHVRIHTSNCKFWNFSFHEMGIHDLPAVVHHISNITEKGGEIVYIGHSMGTTMYLVFSSLLPEAAENIKMAILLAPVAFMTNIKGIFKSLGRRVHSLEMLFRSLGINEMLSNGELMPSILKNCKILLGQRSCLKLFFYVRGFLTDNFNWKITPVLFKQDPAGTSTKTLIHFGQIIKAKGNFQMFDYGKSDNNKWYGSEKPPNYKLNNIRTPIYLIYGKEDPLGNSIDIAILAKHLSNLKCLYPVDLDPFSHIDFLFNIYAETHLYQPILI